MNITKKQWHIPVKPVYYLLLLSGVVLRLIPYLLHRSLWLDEASLAVNIGERNFSGLLNPLFYGQVAPKLFLLIEKLNIVLFGNSEQTLRLFPFICGVLSLPLVYRLTKQLTGNSIAALIALFLFATSSVLINYSNEVKQYESDVFSALCILCLVYDTSFVDHETLRFILLAVAGAGLIFLSNVATLVLFTVGVYYLFRYRLTLFKMPVLLMAFLCWAISFVAYNYFFIRVDTGNRQTMLNYWQNCFMPWQIFSSHFNAWMNSALADVFNIYALEYEWIYLLCGIVFIVKKQWLFLYLLLFPLLLHFIISGFKLYPFDTRLILYVAAFITPAMSIGILEFVNEVKKKIKVYPAIILTLVFAYFIIVQLVNSRYPFWKEEIRQSIDFINANRTEGQKVYVYYASKQPVKYYIQTNRVNFKNDLILEEDDWGEEHRENCFTDVSKLHGCVWLLFSHINDYNGDDTYTIKLLTDTHNKVLKTFKTNSSSAYLVNINPVN